MSALFKFIFPTDKDLFKKVFTLATPVIISNISRVLMGIIDMAMIGHLGGAAIAGVGMGGMVTWTIISLGIAFRTGTQTFVSRRLGQKKYNECSIAMRNMQAFAFLIGIPITLFFYTYTIPIMSFFLDTSTDAFKSSIDYAAFGFLGTYFVYVMFIFQMDGLQTMMILNQTVPQMIQMTAECVVEMDGINAIQIMMVNLILINGDMEPTILM